MKKSKTNFFYLIALLLLLSIFLFQFNNKHKTKSISSKEMFFATCTIEKIEDGSRFRSSICYSFTYDGKFYNDCEQYDISNILQKKLLHIKIPIILSKETPDVHKILLFENDFQSYGLIYPDSLRWIEDFR